MPSQALSDPLAQLLINPDARASAMKRILERATVDLARAREQERSPPRRSLLSFVGVACARITADWASRGLAQFASLHLPAFGLARAGQGGYYRLAHADGIGSIERARRCEIAQTFTAVACALRIGVPGMLWARNSSILDRDDGCFAPGQGEREADQSLSALVSIAPSAQRHSMSAQAVSLIAELSDDVLAHSGADHVDLVFALLLQEVTA